MSVYYNRKWNKLTRFVRNVDNYWLFITLWCEIVNITI